MAVDVETRRHTVLVITAPTTGSFTESGKKVEAHRDGEVMENAAITIFSLMEDQQNATLTPRNGVVRVIAV